MVPWGHLEGEQAGPGLAQGGQLPLVAPGTLPNRDLELPGDAEPLVLAYFASGKQSKSSVSK